jgi:hypothetical protein
MCSWIVLFDETVSDSEPLRNRIDITKRNGKRETEINENILIRLSAILSG